MKSIPKIGDKVQFSDAFCESIQADYDTAALTGVVLLVHKDRDGKIRRVLVQWDDDSQQGVLISNLQRIK